jgi:hypothetical protein
MEAVERMGMGSFESPESASPIITKLVAACLQNRDADGLEFSAMEKIALSLLSRMPVRLSRYTAQWNAFRAALDPGIARELRTEHLVSQRIRDYDLLADPSGVVVMGSALGGAAAHIAAALGAPFLPQPFILGFRGGSPGDEVSPHLEQVLDLAEPILANNCDLHAVGHFDPIHDGWLTRRVTHLRLKLVRLPDGYRQYLRSRLKAGGAIVYLDCGASWDQFEIGSRLRYQIGGWGDIPPWEYLEGSSRIDAYLEAVGSPHRGGWAAGNFQVRQERESEWGSIAGLASDLEEYAAEGGFRFFRIGYDHPHDYSMLAYRAHRALYDRAGVEPEGVLVETFTQYSPFLALKGRLLPLWLIFNTWDSCRFLQEQAGHFPPGIPVYFSALVTLARTPDIAPLQAWRHALGGLPCKNIGAREGRYPEDLESLWKWSERLRAEIGYAGPPLPPLDLETFLALV